MYRLVTVFLLLAFLGCATFGPWTQLEQTEYKDNARGFTASIPKGWMRFNLVKYFLLTRDGTVLEEIAVESHKIDQKLEFTKKEFFKNMSAQDIAEIEIDNFQANNEIKKFEVLSNHPVDIDGREACRVEYLYINKGGLKTRGIHYGFVYKDRVYRIHYEAAAQHYFDKYLQVYNHFIESFKVINR